MSNSINGPRGWAAVGVAFAAGLGGSFGYNFLNDPRPDPYYGLQGSAVDLRVQTLEVQLAGDLATIKADVGHIKESLERHTKNHGNLPR